METLKSISISFQEATGQARELDECADALRKAKRELDGILSDLSRNWSGTAASLYYQKCASLQTKLSRSANDLDQTAAVIRRVARSYYDAERRAIELAQSRNNPSGGGGW